ncbi:sulfatase [Planctomycetes bacterium K23_9]|uniref:Arylsulfatase n=1 Tax=Stieleria marina TaxID=1930275 RepID=A0A517P0V9_9BACT|nr:Arylsulfatase [Planctomycetes bacterium K23_9]
MHRFAKCLCVFLLASFVLPASPAVADDRPNILWIFSEDLSPFMGCYDDPINMGHTPAIDQFATEGVLFKRAFMPAPVCSSCRSAIITGVMQTTTGTHQHRSGRFTNGTVVPEELRIYLPAGIKTIPELMRDAGYFTFNSGKDDYNFHYDRRKLYSVGNEPDYKAGMNGWQGNHAHHNMSVTEDTWNSRPKKSQPWFGQIEIKGGKANAKHVRKGERLAKEAVPLPPYFPDTPGHRASWTMHYNAARGADVRVEEILRQLETDGELDNTVVFFFSDHGSNHSLRHKQFCYEGGVHVPLMVKGKHPALKAGTVRNELVSGLDISATTLAMGNAVTPDYLDGQNLFGDDYKPRDYVISARDRCDYTIDRIRTVRSETMRYIRNYFPDRPLLQAQYRDNKTEVKDFKRLRKAGELNDYQEEHWFGMRPTEELYDLAVDPHQMNNLAADPKHAGKLKKHREILETWIAESGDKGPFPESVAQLKATYDLWKDKPVFKNADVNPEYEQFKRQ